jgi:F0F1-type ATP synthase assembly protein I
MIGTFRVGSILWMRTNPIPTIRGGQALSLPTVVFAMIVRAIKARTAIDCNRHLGLNL